MLILKGAHEWQLPQNKRLTPTCLFRQGENERGDKAWL